MRSASCMFPKIPSVRGTADDHISKELEDADDGENNEHRQPNHVAVAHLMPPAPIAPAMAVMPTKLTKVIIVTRVMPGILSRR